MRARARSGRRSRRVLSAGCTADVLGRMKGFDVTQIILSQPVVEAVLKARNIGRVLAGIEALLLAFVCWYRIHAGAAWIAVTKDWFVGIFVCAYVLTTAGTPAGLERWLWDVGVYLGPAVHPRSGLPDGELRQGRGPARRADPRLQKMVPTLGDDERRLVEAIAWQFSSPCVAGLVGSTRSPSTS